MTSLVERVKQYRAATGCTLREAHDAVLAGKKPRADLCADPALLAEAVEVLRITRAKLSSLMHSEFDGVWSEQDFLDETKAADDFLAKMENRHDR